MGVKKAGGADDDSGSLQCLMGKGGRGQLSGRSLKITSLENNPPDRVMLKEVLQREYCTYIYLHF